MNYEAHEHDVLVIGAGGAGLRAAIEASAAARLSRFARPT
jgi:succinate dehydrogenase / fumarate reductase flavoprotein subunit